MQTRQNSLPIMQTTVRDISNETSSTPLSSTEQSQKQRKVVYSSKSLHMELM